jgi:GrpB-like predicted nucleotidyltransferase (UPF0157 family)
MTDDLNKLTVQELGQLFPIIIADYSADWKELYLKEEQEILRTAGTGVIKRIAHIGSTAVPGLCAKPTIDILMEISESANCDLLVERLRKLLYQSIPKPENPPPHVMLAKGYSEAGIIGQTYHIHVRYVGDWDEIVFRDHLIMNPETAQQYGDLKRRLSIEFKNDREKYTDGKTDFIKRITQRARDFALMEKLRGSQ